MDKIIAKLKGKFIENYPLKNLSWFKIGGIAQYFFSPFDLDDLTMFLKNAPQDINIHILGAGSNTLIAEGLIKGVVIRLNNFNKLTLIGNNKIFAEAGVMNLSVANFALNTKDNNLSGGFEFLSGIPGSIGGAIAMNAGAFGRDLSNICLEVSALDREANIMTLTKEDIGFIYRGNNLQKQLIFISAILQGYSDTRDKILNEMNHIKYKREYDQPKKVLTGGSTFANPEGCKAWELLDKVGLRGYKIGDASFSDKHCNFIINHGKATFRDIDNLISEAKARVKREFNIDLKQEIKYLQ